MTHVLESADADSSDLKFRKALINAGAAEKSDGFSTEIKLIGMLGTNHFPDLENVSPFFVDIMDRSCRHRIEASNATISTQYCTFLESCFYGTNFQSEYRLSFKVLKRTFKKLKNIAEVFLKKQPHVCELQTGICWIIFYTI